MDSRSIGDSELDNKLKEWLLWDMCSTTRAEIEKLQASHDVAELHRRLSERMEFGTAGLRAAMGAGYSRMNDLTIIQTTQGFCSYMMEATPDVVKNGVIVGYDARHNSRRFAQLTAAILLNKGIPVRLFSKICPTPFVAYGVLKKHCEWGIMITASHNPKEDNGYKVYYSNGAQIISPHDKGISSKILANLEPWSSSWDTSICDDTNMCSDPYDEIYKSYMADLTKLSFRKNLNANSKLKFTYTAMHGVGYEFFVDAMKTFDFQPCIPVLEQIEPDPEFPTVKYPNPEEGKSALGFCSYMMEATPDVVKNGVIVGYDARHNSRRFAQLTAAILLNKGIPVRLFSKICPTPFVAYGVLKKHCEWGIMITASHNPKEDNGYKVYYSNGAQIISPHDKGISSKILANLEPWSSSWDTSICDDTNMCSDPYDEIYKSYMADLTKLSFRKNLNANSKLKFTYTAMHGVGYEFFVDAMKTFDFQPCIPVLEQIEPDPEFPTVKYPNPEEGKSALGFCSYMMEATPDVVKNGVIVGYDARHNSRRFAQLTAAILLNKGIPVRLFSKICPTPFVAYGVLKKHCEWGIMITASHNPKEDNGYKVYYSNGAQIISPHDKGISSKILANLEPWSSSWDTSICDDTNMCSDPYDEIYKSYMADLTKLSFRKNLNANSKLKFTYTAMHGVGYEFFVDAMKTFDFQPCIPVLEQIEPDPEFPTVKYPNPEEGKSALDLSVKTANKHNSTVILANDPDADRLALAEKQPDGQWYIFSGNDIGGVVGWWLISQYKKLHLESVSNAYCLASTVSSRLLKAIAEAEGVNYVETLTGFKYMGNKSCDLINNGKTVLFAFEEAIGFMCGTTVLDKDGISAAVVVAEMASHLAETGSTVLQQLHNIKKQYGNHISINSYFICHEPMTIKKMFDRIRNYDGPGKYPEKCGSYTIKSVRDLTTGYDNSQPDNKAILPISKSTQMITFFFENKPCVVTLRTSGTEPKIKYYTEFCATPQMDLDEKTIRAELQQLVDSVVENFMEPTKNNLIARQA